MTKHNKYILIDTGEAVIDGAKIVGKIRTIQNDEYNVPHKDGVPIPGAATLTGKKVDILQVHNGVGWATITGNGETVTFNE